MTTKKANGAKKQRDIFPLSHPRGTKDILPSDQKYWEYVTETVRSFLRGWHYQQIDTPMFEETALFQRAIGEETDIVSKELFELKGRGKGSAYSLRPEGTAPAARAYIEHGMRSWPRPVKLFYMGPFFRYDRPQAGRWRQLHQFGVEVFGSDMPVTDVEVIYVSHLILQQLGLEDYTVKLNTLGEASEREVYIKVLKDHYRRNRQKLCKDCKVRLTQNPLRLLDCKEEKCRQLANTAPRLFDHLGEISKTRFENTLKMLEQLQIPHQLDPSLVRGLDYYTHLVFEVVPTHADESQQNSLLGGGRYNGLVRLLGGRDTPAVGWAAGIERIIDRLKQEGVELSFTDEPKIFVAQLGDQSKIEALKLMKWLREADIPFSASLHRDSMQAQLKAADRLGVDWTLILGHKEVLDETVILRNMESGMQEVVPREMVIEEMRKRLGRAG